jgi:acyl dehydratase
MRPPRQFADDLEAGSEHEIGSRTLTEQEIIDFATQWDPQDFHTNPAVAATSEFGGIVASGVHTFAVFMRLAVDSVYREWAVIAGRSIRDMQFTRPVRPGMRVSGSIRIESVQYSDARPERALVDHTGLLADQDGNPVFTITLAAYVRVRPTATNGDSHDD